MEKPRFNKGKFKELLLYVSEQLEDDPTFGATKLNKVLFYSEFLAFGIHGRPITGATYFRLDKGPAPKQMLAVRDELIEHGDAELRVDRVFNYQQKRLVPKRPANASVFSLEEIAIVDRVVELLRHHNASEVSALSHREAAWKLAGDREDIPYEAVFLSSEPASPRDIERGVALAREHGWLDDSAQSGKGSNTPARSQASV